MPERIHNKDLIQQSVLTFEPSLNQRTFIVVSKEMDILIPWLGAAIAISLIFWRDKTESDERELSHDELIHIGIWLGVAALMSGLGLFASDWLGGFRWAITGIGVGIVSGTCYFAIARLGSERIGFAAALGIGSAVCGWLAPLAIGKGDTTAVLFGATSGAGVVSLCLAGMNLRHRHYLVIVLALGTTATILGIAGGNQRGVLGAAVLLLAACISNLIMLALGSRMLRSTKSAAPVVGVLLFSIAAWLVGKQFLWSESLAICSLAGIGAALLSFWVFRDGESEILRILLSSVLWLGTATVCFGFAKGFGIAVASISGLATLGILGKLSLASAMGPLIGLVIYRAFRETFPDASRAFDIGQHYAIIGLLLGMVAGLLPPELVRQWRASQLSRIPFHGAVLALSMLVAVAGVITLLGAKGAVGWIVGCGSASIVYAFSAKHSLGALASGSAQACLLCAMYSGFVKWTDLSRDQKVNAMIWCMIIVAACILVLSQTINTKREIVQS